MATPPVKCTVRPGCLNPASSAFPWAGSTLAACPEHALTAVETAKAMGRTIKPWPLGETKASKPTKPPPAR